MRLTFISAASTFAILLAGSAHAASDEYPSRPIRVVMPFAPGGSSDALLRILAPKIGEAVRQTVIVDNRPGAGGNVAGEIVAKATPDGYTILMASAMITTNKSLYSKLSYDPEKDFAPVTHLGGGPYVLIAHPSVTAKNIPELIALAKTKPMHYASSGIGGASHLAGELLKMRTGVDLPHVPYKGGGPAALAVLSGESPLLFGTIASSLGYVKAGRVKALAVSGLQRSSFLPDVATIDESGVKGFNVTTWDGFVVPVATPKPIITRIYTETVKVLRTPDVRDSVRGMGYEPTGTTPQEFAQFLRAETILWSKVIKDVNIRAD